MNFRSLFPSLLTSAARPATEHQPVLLNVPASPPSSPFPTQQQWTWTEHDGASTYAPASSLCHFSTSCSALLGAQRIHGSSSSKAEHDTFQAWDGRLPGPASRRDSSSSNDARLVAILASLPFGCIIHAALSHLLDDDDDDSSQQHNKEKDIFGTSTTTTRAARIITSATTGAVAGNLRECAEDGGNPMAWMVSATSEPKKKRALAQLEIIHVATLEDLVAVLVHLLSSESSTGMSKQGPTLTVFEGLSHLLQETDIRQFTLILTLLHRLGIQTPVSQVVLIDGGLTDLRLPICPSLHTAPDDDDNDGEENVPAITPPPQTHLHQVNVFPLLLHSCDWVGSQVALPPTAQSSEAVNALQHQHQSHHRFRLEFEPGHRTEMQHALALRQDYCETGDDPMPEDGEGYQGRRGPIGGDDGQKGALPSRYVLDVDVHWTG